MSELTYENRMRKGQSKPPIACHNAGNWFMQHNKTRDLVKPNQKVTVIPTNFNTRYQPGRFAKTSGLKREYTFSAYDNRMEESRNTRKGLQWDHRKVYETPSFLTWHSTSPSVYQSTAKLSFTTSSQSSRPTQPTWNRFPKVKKKEKHEPKAKALNRPNLIS